MTNMIIGVVGFKGSGKDTLGKHLVRKHGFKQTSFADPLKKSLAMLMDWPQKDLEGVTPESRSWRETPDAWWSEKLGRSVTPRHMMQQFGTEIIRSKIHTDFWVMRTQKLLQSSTQDWVITDVRFPNEMQLIRSMGGILIRVKRGADPDWAARAAWINSWPTWPKTVLTWLDPEIRSVHVSERAWLGHDVHHVVTNDGTRAQLHDQVDQIMSEWKSHPDQSEQS